MLEDVESHKSTSLNTPLPGYIYIFEKCSVFLSSMGETEVKVPLAEYSVTVVHAQS